MWHPAPELNSLVHVRTGDDAFDGAALQVRGQSAALALPVRLRIREPARLTLDWGDGQTTELRARVCRVDDSGRVAHFDVEHVDAGWVPFVEYLGATS